MNKKPQKKKRFYCPKCNDNEITFTLGRIGEKDYCNRCDWEGKVCRECGKEKRLLTLRKTKVKKEGKRVKQAVPHFGYECKTCKMRIIRDKMRKTKKYQIRR